MQRRRTVQSFLEDTQAVSEEFTVLPALSIVMIGIALFFVLFSQTYLTYEERMQQLQQYQTADGIATKLINPDCYFICSGGVVDINILQKNNEPIRALREQFQKGGISFVLRVCWNDCTRDFPDSLPLSISQRVAVTKNIGIYLNEAQTVPGSLTVIIWRLSS